MPLDYLDAPLRLTWDLCPADQTPLAENAVRLLIERLVDAGIFYLLLDERPLLHPQTPEILQRLTATGCQTSLVLGDSAAEWAALAQLRGNFSLFVDAAAWLDKGQGLAPLEQAFARLEELGIAASLLWVPEAGRLLELFPLLELCERCRIPRFKLPNRKINANPDAAQRAGILSPVDLDQLARALEKQPLKATNSVLEVHDLFLWELLFPDGGGTRSEYGGCQAGNSLGHLAVNGDLWPCSSWPQVLGNLLQQDLADIWDSARRHQVRDEVAGVPADCADCRDYAICFGGCRGLARSCRQDGRRRDLLCRGPRPK
jgi:GeoRSP system SPASM domain protein